MAVRKPAVELPLADRDAVAAVDMTGMALCAGPALAAAWAVNAAAPTSVRACVIAPLPERPDLVERIAASLAEPEEVAAAIVFLASPPAAMIAGHTLLAP